ncbi:hypothetical protein ACMFLR_18980 [Delftia tsuruhatensis]|uniref:hypothetical protein n=1 Tax=Delftia tsuruhatensis TaxID=180282 RepID=UPI00244CA4E1|nr:hypothetical protein [Delftia tsuruhatensis]MDH0423518.1 hypothetical protein [Delftia tsuruhatensis]
MLLVDPAKAARHPAIAEFALRYQQDEIERLLSLVSSLAAAKPMPPELVRAALARQPQALEFSADAI